MEYILNYSGNIKDKKFAIRILHHRVQPIDRWINRVLGHLGVNGVGTFVCDVLNQNYSALIGAIKYGEDFEEKYGKELGFIKHAADRDNETLKEEMIKELSELDFSLVKKFAWEIFCNTKHEALDTETKFFVCNIACSEALGINNKNPFSQPIKANICISYAISEGLNVGNIFKGVQGTSDNFTQILENLCIALKNSQKTASVRYQVIFSSIKDIFIYLFIEMVKQNGVIKKCPNCGRFFYPVGRSDTIYCSYPSPQEPQETCQQYANYTNYLRKTQTDTATKLHKQIYNIKANRAKRNPNNKKLAEDLELFLVRSRQWKKDVKNGSADEAQYIEWLQKIKDNDA